MFKCTKLYIAITFIVLIFIRDVLLKTDFQVESDIYSEGSNWKCIRNSNSIPKFYVMTISLFSLLLLSPSFPRNLSSGVVYWSSTVGFCTTYVSTQNFCRVATWLFTEVTYVDISRGWPVSATLTLNHPRSKENSYWPFLFTGPNSVGISSSFGARLSPLLT